ncbi:hypothetical protein J6590_042354 [Homalodisca vitripennis]|nr:hypothetical protein J6590_042354 [Homalodisca vitripennis]
MPNFIFISRRPLRRIAAPLVTATEETNDKPQHTTDAAIYDARTTVNNCSQYQFADVTTERSQRGPPHLESAR